MEAAVGGMIPLETRETQLPVDLIAEGEMVCRIIHHAVKMIKRRPSE